MSALDICTFENPVEGSVNLCSNKVEYWNYGYNITRWTAILFVILFGLTGGIHIAQAIRTKRWFLLPTIALCALIECLGWSGRLWSSISTQWWSSSGGFWYSNDNAFLMQISTLIFAPVFLSAAWYIGLGKIISTVGPQYSRLTPKSYSIIFLTGDLISLIVQAVGGGIASGAPDDQGAEDGANIMVGGVIIQMIVMVAYSIMLIEFSLRFFSRRPVKQIRFRRTQADRVVDASRISPELEKRVKILIAAFVFSTFAVFIRSIFRTIELLDGWRGKVITTESYFVGLDALPVFLAVAVFNFINPGSYLPREDEIGREGMEMSKYMDAETSRTNLAHLY